MKQLTTRERFSRVLRFQPVDRLPVMEWATWWDKTLDRWLGEGMPAHLNALPWPSNVLELQNYFGLDNQVQFWFGSLKETAQRESVANAEDYERMRPHLFPENPMLRDMESFKSVAERQQRGELAVWITLEGFFWHPRTLFGIERHLYAFYDESELMHRMNSALLEFHLRTLDECCSVCVPDFMTVAEDMSYNHGPMISKAVFDEFIAPYYRRLVPKLKEYGIVPIIDSDGDIARIIPWFAEAGVDGFLPLERQAGVDVNALRKEHPQARFIGAYDKMVMSKGESEMREEFERLLPAMKSGGYIPSVDHQTPPGVSLANYRIYLKLLKEYCARAGG